MVEWKKLILNCWLLLDNPNCNSVIDGKHTHIRDPKRMFSSLFTSKTLSYAF
jgi:hypothetical protein